MRKFLLLTAFTVLSLFMAGCATNSIEGAMDEAGKKREFPLLPDTTGKAHVLVELFTSEG